MTLFPLNGLQFSSSLPKPKKLRIPRIFHRGGNAMAARLRAWLRSSSAGGALVEMALVMPIMFLILTGIFSFGIATNQKMELTEAVNVGGSLLAVSRGQPDPCSVVATAVDNAAPSLKSSNITFSFDLNGVTTSGTSCPGTGGAANPNLVGNKNAELTLTYPCVLSVYGKNFGTCTLTSQITEVVQ
jgi:Flp pilus assembly protein TadG